MESSTTFIRTVVLYDPHFRSETFVSQDAGQVVAAGTLLQRQPSGNIRTLSDGEVTGILTYKETFPEVGQHTIRMLIKGHVRRDLLTNGAGEPITDEQVFALRELGIYVDEVRDYN